MVHGFWLAAWRYQLKVWIETVPSKRNLSDLPSRECYSLLERLGAVRVEAAMPAF